MRQDHHLFEIGKAVSPNTCQVLPRGSPGPTWICCPTRRRFWLRSTGTLPAPRVPGEIVTDIKVVVRSGVTVVRGILKEPVLIVEVYWIPLDVRVKVPTA